MKLALSEIAQAVHGRLIGQDLVATGTSIDTRTLLTGDLYIAIKGARFDGHEFAETAKQSGACGILTHHEMAVSMPQIVVQDSHLALAELAGYWRKKLPVKVAGVTGSNGKTSVKEMIAAIFGRQGKTLFTQGNLNNDIGVPLTLLRLDASHHFAVIEMGANHPGEIAYTSRFAQADVSVITNIGPAHIEGFGDIDGVAKTKAEIIENLNGNGVAVLNRDDKYYEFLLHKTGQRQSVSFGFHETAHVRAENVSSYLTTQGFVTQFDLQTIHSRQTIRLALAGSHNVKNACAAAAVALQFGIDLAEIKQALEAVKPVNGRMRALQGHKGNIVIDDTYNANPASLQAALDAVKETQLPVWLVLGAFGELGINSATLHADMADMIKGCGVQRLFATGELARHTTDAFGENALFFDNQESLIQHLNNAITGKEIILVKGSRAQKMENVVAALVDNFYPQGH